MTTKTFAGNNLSESDYADLAAEAANNHAKFDSFAWHAEPADGELWTLVYTSNRDSGALDKANAQVIEAELARFIACGTVRSESHSHWACGYVDGYAIKVYTSRGKITKAFRVWCDIKAALDDYPILDESVLSEIEQEEIDESWDCWIRSEFERELERKFDRDDFDIPSDKLAELFYQACSDASEYPQHSGDEVCVDFDRIMPSVTEDMVREFVPVKPIRIFRDGYPLVDGSLHLDEYTGGLPLYDAEFFACIEAHESGAESLNIDGHEFTWTIG